MTWRGGWGKGDVQVDGWIVVGRKKMERVIYLFRIPLVDGPTIQFKNRKVMDFIQMCEYSRA